MRRIKKAYIEITNICNLACPFCPGTARAPRYMSESDFRGILGHLAGGVECLYFHVMGEPLLHPDLGRLLDVAGEFRLPVNLTTNGTLLGEVGEGLIGKPALRQVNVSLHSRPDADGGYLDSILAFAALARRGGRILVTLRLWNAGECPDDVAIRIERRLAEEFGLGLPLVGLKADNRGVMLADGVYYNRAEPFEWPGLHCEDLGGKGYCKGLRDQIGVLCDGTAVPCCLDGEGAVALGNLLHQPLAEILDSERVRAIYDGFTRREAVEELCRRCGYRKRFG